MKPETKSLTKKMIDTVTQVNKYNRTSYPKIDIKYDAKKGIAILAPITTEHFQAK